MAGVRRKPDTRHSNSNSCCIAGNLASGVLRDGARSSQQRWITQRCGCSNNVQGLQGTFPVTLRPRTEHLRVEHRQPDRNLEGTAQATVSRESAWHEKRNSGGHISASRFSIKTSSSNETRLASDMRTTSTPTPAPRYKQKPGHRHEQLPILEPANVQPLPKPYIRNHSKGDG